MSEPLLAALNPGQHFDRAGASLVVVDTAGKSGESSAKAARVEVDKNRQVVKLFDRSNALIGFYPATVGSAEKPSPTGTLKVTAVNHNPTYGYNPDYHFKGVRATKRFEIEPGPNNPVGTIWINLSAEGYGIHGTPSPGKVSKAESHGCVRLTNWDAERVADRVSKGVPVDFVDDPQVVRTAGIASPLPLAGEVASHRKMRCGWGLYPPHDSRRDPHPGPPPQAGEGAQLHRRTVSNASAATGAGGP